MTRYTLNMAGGGEVDEFFAAHDGAAEVEALRMLADRGYPDAIPADQWDGDGTNDDGQPCERLLFWANADDAENDAGAKAIAQLCVVRD
jgi:hypothetical protein